MFIIAICMKLLVLSTIGVHSVEDPPQIVEKPKDLRMRVGSIATFYCRVTGDPPPQVHWRKNGKKVSPAHSRIFINNYGGVAMLRIEPIRHQRDDATYECRAENGVGDPVTAYANLAVFAEGEVPEGFPIITDPPMTKVLEKGSTATLACNATGAPPLRVIWLKDLFPFTPTERLSFLGDKGETLQITDVAAADAGSYDCIVENPVGTESSSMSAKVYVKERRVPPEFSLPPDPLYEVMLGADLNLTCVAVGSPMPTVQWRKGIESLNPDDAIPIGKNILMLKNIRETGVYTCIATSKLGIKEVNITVKVQSLPKPPNKVRVSDVTASSVQLTWSYEPAETEDVTYYVIQYKPKYSNQDFAEISGVLNKDHRITSLNPYTEYEFSVIAFNKVGRGAPSGPLEATTGETKPKSAPRNVTARPLSCSQMLVNWDEPDTPNGQITGYKVYFTTNPTLPLQQWDAKRVESNEMTNIHDLTPRTIYTIRVQAYTAIGLGPVSLPIQVKTEPGVPGQPRNFRTTSITPTSVTLEWTKPSYIGNNIVGYELYWKENFSKERNYRSVPVGESYTLSGLYPNTKYFMWLAAKSIMGEGATTPPIPVHTEECTPGAPPQKFLGESEDSTSIRINWSPPPEDKQHGDIKYYKVFFVENDLKDEDASQVTITDPYAREFVIDQLRKWTDYRIWILAGNSVGDGPHTKHILIRTDEDERRVPPEFSLPPDPLYEVILGADLNLTCVAVGPPMPTVLWRKGTESLTPDDSIPIGNNILMLKNIRETAVYTCIATSKLGIKEVNTTVKVQSLPTPPYKVRVSDVTASSVRLTWSHELEESDDVTYYVIQYKPKYSNQDFAEISGVLNKDYMIASLNPHTEYEFSVIAFNKVGRGAPSAHVEATTCETGKYL